MVEEVKENLPTLKVKAKPNPLVPLTPQETARVVEGFTSQGATCFNFEQFQKLTSGLPPNTRIVDILKFLRRTK